MSIRKRKWGDDKEAWIVDILVRGTRVRKQLPTLKDAKAFEHEVQKQARAGTYRADGSKMRVKDLIAGYFELLDKRNLRGKRMTRAHLIHVKGHISNYVVGGIAIIRRGSETVFAKGIADHRLTDLTPHSIETFFDDLIDTGLTTKTVKEIKNSLAGLIEYARRQNYIAVNVVKGIAISEARNAKAKRRTTVPPKLLVSMMIERADEFIAILVKFAALTGVRAGEQRALRWRHVDFKMGLVRVETRFDRWGEDDGQGTKTLAGNREIPISSELSQALTDWRAKTKYSQPDDLIFANKLGRPIGHTRVLRAYFRLFKTCMAEWPASVAKPPRPRWHDLRHFAVSCWIEAGMMPKAVQEFAGHASLATTMDRYGHLFPSEQYRQTMDRVALNVLSAVD